MAKVPYPSRPQRYEYHLTAKGADLLPVLRGLVEWANRHLPGTSLPPPSFMEKAAEVARMTTLEEDPA